MKPNQKTISSLHLLIAATLLTFGLQASAPAEIYRYDVTGRLIRVGYDDGSGISYVYDKNGNILAVEARAVAADINANGRVELADYARIQRCFSSAPGEPISPACQSTDVNADGTVDLDDIAQFQGSMTGP